MIQQPKTTMTVAPPATVSAEPSSGSVVLNWSSGTLQSTTNIMGPWEDVVGATSPLTNPASAEQEFNRLKLQ
jgi:hypothetical protein